MAIKVNPIHIIAIVAVGNCKYLKNNGRITWEFVSQDIVVRWECNNLLQSEKVNITQFPAGLENQELWPKWRLEKCKNILKSGKANEYKQKKGVFNSESLLLLMKLLASNWRVTMGIIDI